MCRNLYPIISAFSSQVIKQWTSCRTPKSTCICLMGSGPASATTTSLHPDPQHLLFDRWSTKISQPHHDGQRRLWQQSPYSMAGTKASRLYLYHKPHHAGQR